jgi:choline dehydrogenase-like flavoprotein
MQRRARRGDGCVRLVLPIDKPPLMLLDARNESEVPSEVSGDVVIVGAGTVGLYLATRLAQAGRQVVVVEAGGRVAETSQNALTAQCAGKAHNGITLGRAAGLGGTSVLWGGQLAEFEPADLHRNGVEWPLEFSELRARYETVYDRLGLRTRAPVETYRRKLGNETADHGEIERFFTLWLPQPNFAKFFKPQIVSAPQLRVLLNAGVDDIEFTGDTARTIRALVGDRHIRISGRQFIFASGTIATSRFFLSTQRTSAVPWRDNANIGRYFQDHLGGKVADVKVINEKRFREFFENAIVGGVKLQPKLRFTHAARKAADTPGVCGLFSFDSAISENIANIKRLLRAIKAGSEFSGIKTIHRDVHALGRAFIPIVVRYARDRRVLAFFDRKLEYHVQAEQLPVADSRITVAGERGSDGLLRASVDWRIDGREIDAIRTFALYTDAYLRARGIASLEIDSALAAGEGAFVEKLSDTYHQAGGMCMSRDPASGVVDPDCRMWRTANVYVGGASVFPTSSHANCTLTALALADRLAETLERAA